MIREDDEAQYLLTNRHVVEDATEVALTYYAGARGEWTGVGTVLARSAHSDLALIKVVPPAKRPRPLTGGEQPHELAPVVVSGFPFGEALATNSKAPAVTLTRAAVSSIRKGPLDDVELLQLDNNINPGNSGGPVVDQTGHVVGIAVATIRGSGISFVIPWSTANAFLEGELAEVLATPEGACEENPCPISVDVTLIDPFRKADAVEIRLIEADASYLEAEHPHPWSAEGRALSSTTRPASGAFSAHANTSIDPAHRYFVQLALTRAGKVTYASPTELSLARTRGSAGTANARPPLSPGRNVAPTGDVPSPGVYELVAVCCGGRYVHTMKVTTSDAETRTFSGTGYSNSEAQTTWDLRGQATPQGLQFSLSYRNKPYVSQHTGTISGEGWRGVFTTTEGQRGDWQLTRLR